MIAASLPVYTYKAFISYSHRSTPDIAGALQAGLYRLAKPILAIRALQVFRDKTSLSANPELWPSIVRALEQSEYFLLMASPEAAASKWVNQEVGWWIQNRSTRQFLIATTSGEISWDGPTGDFDWTVTNCLPANLKSQFVSEPRWVDLRWAKQSTDLSLNHSQFRAAVLDFAAPLHGKAKEDLDSDDVRQRRRLRTAIWITGCALLALTVFSIFEANRALSSQRAAELQQAIAVAQKRIAEGQTLIAQQQAKLAEERRIEAERQTRLTAAQLARNWYKLSQDASPQSAIAAFALATQAAQVAPDDDGQLGTYLDRVINLAGLLPNGVLNLPVTEGIQTATFNSNLSKVAVVTDNSKIRVFDLPSGSSLFVPDFVNEKGHAGPPPEFDADGVSVRTYVQWFHPEPDPDETGRYVLEAGWNPVNRSIHTPVDDGRISVDDLKWTVLRRSDSPDEPSPPEPAAVYRGFPHLKSKIPPPKGAAANRSKVMTATADGSIFTWSVREAKELSNTRQLAAKERWVSAIFAGEKLVALDRSGTLSVWSLASGATLWSRKLPHHSATIQVSPDASSILADFSSHHQNGASGTWAVYDLSSGQPLEKEDHEETRGDVILSTSLMHSTDIVSAWSFYTGNGDDLILEYPELRRAGSDCVNPGPKAREFLEFLLNGRYFLAGSAGTFQIHELCSAKALASFYFGEVSSLSPNLAQSLIERVVEIDGSSAQRVRLHLRDGPWLEANPAPGVSTRLTLATGGESIVTPRDGKFADGDLVVLSGDGKWMAVTKQKTFSVWDARTGFALSAPLSIEEKPLDIQFTADGRSIRLALPNGSVLTQTLRFRWKGKPAWLTGLSEALTGRFAEPSGAIGRVPARELPGIRARVLAQLQMFAPVDPAAAHLNRLFGWIGN